MALRRGSKSVKVENSGLVVFLYDDARRAALRKASPPILSGFSSGEQDDEGLGPVAGMLVAYELPQDDQIVVEVAIGDPLTEAEKKGAPWLQPQLANLSLPSGKLRVEGYDSLRIGPEEPSEKGGSVIVPPGDYVVSIERLDLSRREAKWKGPNEFIALRPVAGATPVKEPKVVLRYPEADHARASASSVKDGVFLGRCPANVVPGYGATATDMSRAHAAALGLRRGMRLNIEYFGITARAVYLAGLSPHESWSGLVQPGVIDALRGTGVLAAWFQNLRRGTGFVEGLVVGPLPGEPAPQDGVDPKKDTVAVSPTGESAFAPNDDAPLLGAATVASGELSAPVLASSPDRLVFAAPAEGFSRLGVRPGQELLLEIGTARRRLLLAPEAQQLQQARRVFEERFANKEPAGAPPKTFAEIVASRKKEQEVSPDLIAQLPLHAFHRPHWDVVESQITLCIPLLHEKKRLDLGLLSERGAMIRLRCSE